MDGYSDIVHDYSQQNLPTLGISAEADEFDRMEILAPTQRGKLSGGLRYVSLAGRVICFEKVYASKQKPPKIFMILVNAIVMAGSFQEKLLN